MAVGADRHPSPDMGYHEIHLFISFAQISSHLSRRRFGIQRMAKAAAFNARIACQPCHIQHLIARYSVINIGLYP